MKRSYTTDERELVFSLWKKGCGFSDIGRVLDAKPGSVFTILREHGGIRPAIRKRAANHLTLEEREEIRAGLSAKMSIRAIAQSLNRSPSTISREVNRNRGRRWYKAIAADNRAWRCAKRPKACALEINRELRQTVIEKLQLFWSPEQIAGWLRRHYPGCVSMHVSHETIYKTVYVRSRKALDHRLACCFRRGHKMRQGKKYSRSGDRGTISIVNGVSIHQRDSTVDSRRTIGHWEGDLVTGSGNTHIATLVERKTRFTLLLKVAGKDADSVNSALVSAFNGMPCELRQSLTWDRGMELAKHSEFSQQTNMPVYFCDTQSPWQRGTNENTNSLVRQYFPKKTCLSRHSQEVLNHTAAQLNGRPRKTLHFMSPAEAMEEAVALTG